MRKTLLAVLFALNYALLPAHGPGLTRLGLEARVDYSQERLDGDKIGAGSGFKGRFFNFRMDGQLGGGFSYTLRQRLNRSHSSESFFNATDWLELTYSRGAWSFSGGKQIVQVGGWDYDRAPIDLHFYSEYLCNIACYQMGVSTAWTSPGKTDRIVLQLCQSPFRAKGDGSEMLGYNLLWSGKHGAFSSLWSVNMLEYLPGKFINYLSLGSKLTSGNFIFELDLMNRAVDASEFLGKDITLGAKALWSPTSSLDVFLKCSYDRNVSTRQGDWCVVPGTKITRYGGGLEFFPLKGSRNVRLHLSFCRASGTNPSPWAVLLDRQSFIDAGVTWRMDLIKRH